MTVRFATDMRAMGDPRSAVDPMTMACNAATVRSSEDGGDGSGAEAQDGKKIDQPKYSSRWADSRNWVLDFAKPLAAGVRCAFKLKADIKDLSGAPVNAVGEYSFTTAGPSVLGVAPAYGEIEPDQYFVALIDGAVDAKSVHERAFFEVSGMPDKVALKIVDGEARDLVVPAALRDNWRWSSYAALVEERPAQKVSQMRDLDGFLVLGAARRFPEGGTVVLHWPRGILSKSGLPTDVDQKFTFKVIPPFRATFTCQRTTPERPCNPILDMNVTFPKRLPLSSLKGTKLVAPDGRMWTPVELAEGDKNKNSTGIIGAVRKLARSFRLVSNFEDAQVDIVSFRAPFPESTQFKLILPAGIKDELNRPLVNQKSFPLMVATDEYSPLIKFPAPFGVLEAAGEPMLPVSVRNVEKNLGVHVSSYEGQSLSLAGAGRAKEIIDWYHKVIEKDWQYERRKEPLLKGGGPVRKFQLPKPGGEREFELIGIPLKTPGFHIVELESPRLGAALLGSGPMYVATATLVTNMAVHFKWGRESSLVWVTQLGDARPVADAKILVMSYFGKEVARGATDKDGLLRLGPFKKPCEREEAGEAEGPEGGDNCELFVFAERDRDLSFTSTFWSKGIESYRFNISQEYSAETWGPAVIHTVLDRMAAQPGDTVQMKHVLREHHQSGMSFLASARLPKTVFVVHTASNKSYSLPFEYDKTTGTAINKFIIPKDATLGMYQIYLSNKTKLVEDESGQAFDWTAMSTGTFTVSEYRLPLMKASVRIQGQPLVRPTEIKIDLSAHYLSGGPAKGLKIKLRSSMQPVRFTPDIPEAGDYSFFAEPLKAGITNSERDEEDHARHLTVQTLALNNEGGLGASLRDLPAMTSAQLALVEMEYTDPNGEVKTASASAPIYPAAYTVGLRAESWLSVGGKARVSGVIADTNGKPAPGRPFVVDAFPKKYITHRKRLVGGFYAYDSKIEVTAAGKVCEGKSDEHGRFACEPKDLAPGSILLQARTTDDLNRSTYAAVNINVYETGADSWWVPSDSDRIDILPEKTRYEPGETANLVVRTPYPTATALVTVEREGVLTAFLTEVKRDKPIIAVPIKGTYAPNVMVSVLLVRGRVAEPKPTALLDLARPSMKMGLINLRVGWKVHELLVDVKSDKKTYRARDQVAVNILVKAATGAVLPAGAEIAVAVIDEGLLRLKENTSWKLLEAMMGARGLAVATSSGQNQVIGLRHFGSKAKPPGGGGGDAANEIRDLFEPVLLWQPRVKLDAGGSANVTVPLNDSMTSFRIVAIAQAGAELFGDGSTTVESTKDLILYSGFAPLVREGDQIDNSVTMRNTTARPMKIELTVATKDLAAVPKIPASDLGANEARTLVLPLTVPLGAGELSFQLHAKDTLSNSEDRLAVKVRVDPAVPERVLQATLFQLQKPEQISVQQPPDAIAGRGALAVHVRPTLVTGLGGVKSYMEEYTYSCLEQKVSRAIVLENKSDVEKVIDSLPAYMDAQGLLKFFPSSNCGSATLTQYIMDILQENAFTIPETTRTRALEGLQSFVHGKVVCHSWWDELVRDPYLDQAKLLALETLSRFKAFNAQDLATLQLTPNLWKSTTVAAWFNLLKREQAIPNREPHLKQAANILRSRLNFQGSLMNLQGELDWEAAWRLFSSRDQEALEVLALATEDPSWAEDIGRMARGVVARLRLGHWDTTMANAWGVTALRKFSAKFEAEKITGETKFGAGDVSGLFNWQTTPRGERRLFAWPNGSQATPVPVQFTHSGGGMPWIHFQTSSAIPLKGPFDMGYKISRRISPVTQEKAGSWHVGDVVNVELTITAKADQAWVVVRDPVPAGASHLGTGLDGSSNLLNRTPQVKAAGDKAQAWPTEFEEKAHAYFTSYAAYLPRGTYVVNYRLRLNSAGDFRLPPSRVEAMYAPETFGEAPNGNWKVVAM